MSNSDPIKPRQDKEIFFEALDLATAEERAAFLDAACRNDPAQRARVEELLAIHFKQNPFMQEPAAEGSPPVLLTADLTEGPGSQIGRYKLLEKLGEGGFGVVYVAEQKEPVKRRVALKIIKLGMDTRQVVARFEAERQALALMDHPNIAKVLDGGATDTGRLYFVMELVRGMPITRYCDENSLSTVERLKLFILVCQAIQHAHQKGIIHRDIKPSNIMVTLHDGVPVPKVIDFGVAKAIEGELTDKTIYTQFQQFIGTPAYMSPEQAELSGLGVDTRTDIYAVGVLLYELLVGKTPFDAKDLLESGLDEMRRTIREKEPVRPSTRLTQTLVAVGVRSLKSPSSDTQGSEEEVRASSRRLLQIKETITLLKGDLDWIVMKCLEKDRTRRYATANDLAADLLRHLNNEPVVARPPSSAYRLQRAFRRNRLIFSAGMAVAAALLIGTSVSVWQAVRATRAKKEALQARQIAELGRQTEVVLRQQAEAEKERADQSLYESDMRLAQHAWDDDDLGLTLSLLEMHQLRPGETDRRGFEWFYFWNLCKGDRRLTLTNQSQAVMCVAFSPDGKRLATGSVGEPVQIWDTATSNRVMTVPEQHVISLAFAPDGQTLGVGGRDKVVVWNLQTERAIFKKEKDLAEFRIAFSPVGNLMVIGKQSWPHRPDVGSAELWDYVTGELKRVFPESGGQIALSAQGDRLATANWNQSTTEIWDLASGQCVSSVETGGVLALALSPDGQTVATGLGSWSLEVQLWDVTTGLKIGSLTNSQHQAWGLAFSPDGRSLATGGADQMVRVWDVATCQQTERLQGHGSEVMTVAFSPDGHQLASGSKDKKAMLWNVHPNRAALTNLISSAPIFSPDSRSMAVGIGNNKVAIWSVATLQEEAVFDAAHAPVAFSNNGSALLTRGTNYFLRTFNVGTKAVLDTILRGPVVTNSNFVLSPDGQIVATSTTNGAITFSDAKTGAMLATHAHAYGGDVFQLAFSPNGKLLATTGLSDETDSNALAAKIWDTTTHKLVPAPVGHTELVIDAAFSPDGKILATCGVDDSTKFWDTATWQEILPSLGQKEYVSALAFSPNGKTLATACNDGTLKLWNVATHREVASLKLGIYGARITFSPDSQTLAVWGNYGQGGALRVWRAPALDTTPSLPALQQRQMEKERN